MSDHELRLAERAYMSAPYEEISEAFLAYQWARRRAGLPLLCSSCIDVEACVPEGLCHCSTVLDETCLEHGLNGPLCAGCVEKNLKGDHDNVDHDVDDEALQRWCPSCRRERLNGLLSCGVLGCASPRHGDLFVCLEHAERS